MRGKEIEEEKIKKFGEDTYRAIEAILTDEELRKQHEDEQAEKAKMRMIYDWENDCLDLSKSRATDVKWNSRVISSKKVKNFDIESKIEMFRIECKSVFMKYMRDNCEERGKQKSNLTMQELKGLKSLKKKIENGEIDNRQNWKVCCDVKGNIRTVWEIPYQGGRDCGVGQT